MRAAAIAGLPFEEEAVSAPKRKIKAAMAFLREALKDGPRPAKEVEAEAIAAGYAPRTLAHARKRAYIHNERKGNQWIWSTAAQRKQAAKTQVAN